jgi:hypothetical protein
MFKTTDAVG